MIRRLVKAPILGEDLWDDIHCPIDPQTKSEKAFNSKYQILGDERLVLMHTRKRTTGSEYINHNNMPIFSSNWVMVHNGVVTAPRLERYPYKGTVDSEEILARIERYSGDLFRALPEISGSMAIIAKHFSSDHLLIYRNSNPLELVYQPSTQLLVGVSRAEYAMDGSTREDYNSIFEEKGIAFCQIAPHYVYRVHITSRKIDCLGKVESLQHSTTTMGRGYGNYE